MRYSRLITPPVDRLPKEVAVGTTPLPIHTRERVCGPSDLEPHPVISIGSSCELHFM